ncbi:MAG: magnesium transporter [Myxococcota bacterium]
MRPAVAMLPEVRALLAEQPAALVELMDEIHDEDLADLLSLLEVEEAIKLLEELDPEAAADIFERLEEREQAELVERFGPLRLAPIVSEMAPDDRVDLVEALPEDLGGRLVEGLDPEARDEVRALIDFPEDTAGGLMTTDLIRLSPDLAVNEVIEQIRKQGDEAETIYYVYGVEADGRLSGVASLRDLIMAEGHTQLRDIMSEQVRAVSPETDQEEVARVLRKYDFTAMPVVDHEERLLGLITIDDVMDVVEEEQDEDVQRLAAVEPIEDAYFQTSTWVFVRKRVPWLAVLFAGQFVTESILRIYDPIIRLVTQLTFYLPMLISTGGNSGGQSASLIIRGLATGDIHVSDWWRVLTRELAQGAILGTVLGLVGVARVLLVGDGNQMAFTIGITVVTIVTMGCTVGAMLPLLLSRLGLDPATSSTPFVATLVDVLGILLYFSLAKVALAEALVTPT